MYRSLIKKSILFFLILFIQFNAKSINAVKLVSRKDSIFLYYNQQIILKARLSEKIQSFNIQQNSQVINGANYQLINISAANFNKFELFANVMGSDESIACESDPRINGLKVVRNTIGQSHSLLNNAIYERKHDWLLSFDAVYPKLVINAEASFNYTIHFSGTELIIRFKPNYYQKHRGLSYFNPEQYSVWKKPVVGWCSWFAYFNKVTELDVKKTTDVLSNKLAPFGLNYVQIDDGYQQTPIGMPETWLETNKKFPSGLSALSKYIQSKGLTPALWTNVAFNDSAAAYAHKELFVRNENGNPAIGNWIGYSMDGLNPKAIQTLITPVYKELNKEGWQYIKLDALRHLKYEGYNSNSAYFLQKKANRNEAYRNIVRAVRNETGKDHFLMACWGIRPELVGIVDGCRIGNDGYSYAGLAQFNSYNNIIWRNDPDHIELSPKEAYRSCVATSLTGSLFMLTDKAEVYENSKLIEAAKRSIPVLYTQPAQVYDVDPSRSALIAQADVEMSGSGPRPFDASSSSTTGLFSLEINKPFENWVVLGRLDDRDQTISVKDLGLNDQKEYLLFEFWRKEFRGIVKKQFNPGTIDSNFHCQVFCLREKQNHPQLLATNRHISCGALEIESMQWNNRQLNGSSTLVADDVYTMYIYEPEGYSNTKVTALNADVLKNEKEGMIRKISLQSKNNSVVHWEIDYIAN
jgi:hypothetical protein